MKYSKVCYSKPGSHSAVAVTSDKVSPKD